MKINDIMTHRGISLTLKSTLREALDTMVHNSINGTPIIDDDGQLMGMVTNTDIYQFLVSEGHYDTYPIEYVMTKDVVKGNVEDDVTQIAMKIRENNIVAMPVVDENNKVLGMISIENLLDYFINKNKE